MIRKWLFTILAAAIYIPNGLAENIKVGFYNHPPYMIESNKSGIYHDVFDQFSKLTNDTFEIQYYPYPRLKALFNSEEVDIEPGVHPLWVHAQSNPGMFSSPIGQIVGVLVFGPEKRFPVTGLDDLTGKVLGLVNGYEYPNIRKLLDNGTIIHGEGESEGQLLEMLANGRFDQVLIGEVVAEYLIRRNKRYSNFELGYKIGSYDVCVRVQSSKNIFLSRLNAAIDKMHKSGSFKSIYAKYGITWK